MDRWTDILSRPAGTTFGGVLTGLTSTGRHLRVALLAVAGTLLLLGTLVGQDDAFPFGPFRMYATADAPNGSVLSTRLEAVTVDGAVVRVGEGDIGMRRAEYEGQLPSLSASALGDLARVHARRRPDAPTWRVVRLVRDAYGLHDRRPTGTVTSTVLLTWTAP